MKRPLRVGFTGGIGSGKTTACRFFTALGVPIIDADEIARNLVAPGTSALELIAENFGREMVGVDGKLDRARMRSVVFSSPENRKKLESIIHPLVFSEIERLLKEINSAYCIICIPLLLETGNTGMFDRILVIDVPEEIQVERAAKRDNTDPLEIQSIINTQVSRSERLELADDILHNDRDQASLENQVKQLHEKYTSIAKTVEET